MPVRNTSINLNEITDVLLSPELDSSAVRNACASLAQFFYDISGLDTSTRKNQENILTSAGVAIGPSAAALCIIDMMRTRNFLQGIREAIDTRLKLHPGRPVIVFYAGTGPFATLITPLTTLFNPGQLQMVLLEINPLSIAYLHQVVNHLKMEPYIIDVIETDATTYIIPDHQQPDILISETLKPGLENEPWVSIVTQLIPQCKNDPILIPSLIKVEASLIGTNEDFSLSVRPLKTLLEFTAEAAIRLYQDPRLYPVFSEGILVTIDELRPGHRRLALTTTIQVFNHHFLDLNECGLTIPLKLMDAPNLKKLPASFLFRYELGSKPGFTLTEL